MILASATARGKQRDHMNLDGPALAHGIDTLVGLALQIHLPHFTAQNRSNPVSHLILAGTDLGLLTDDRDVEISEAETLVFNAFGRLSEESPAVSILMPRVVIRKQLPDIRLANRPEQGVGHGVQDRVAVRVANRADGMVKRHAAEHERSTRPLRGSGLQPVQVVSMADTAGGHTEQATVCHPS